MPHALIVDADTKILASLVPLVEMQGFTTSAATTLRDAREQLTAQRPDVVLLDVMLPDGNGLDLFQSIEPDASIEIVLMTAQASIESSVQALRLGASDYLVKPINIKQLKDTLARITRSTDLKDDIGYLQLELRRAGRFGHLLGSSPVMQEIYDQIGRVAPTTATVLIVGESGSGKELVAQTLHDLSRRRQEVFLPVNCGAISPLLIESELFGHEKGSFTGAVREHKGYFERAGGGTLFLDEITEMPMELQVKLLRVLETGAFMRVGSDREMESDVRVLAATNRSLDEAVASGRLREDLLYRLQVFPLHLPALRERGEDVEQLAEHFLQLLNVDQGTRKKLHPTALAALQRYLWPGNIRELKNVIHRAFIMANEWIDTDCLPMEFGSIKPAKGPVFKVHVGQSIADVERQLILATLDETGGNKEKSATILGLSLKTLYNRLNQYASEDSLSLSD